MKYSTTVALAGLATTASAGYSVKEDFFSGNFFDHWNFETFPSRGGDPTHNEPTHGFVNYVDQNTAQSQQYINTNNGAYIGVDHANVASSAGRDSVRITSKSNYGQALIVLDLAHMPGGVEGTWPAFWTVGPNWPNNGEVDIIEGVNSQSTNFMTIHSGNPSCKMESKGSATLTPFSTNCIADSANEGCSYHDDDSSSYGTVFNQAGGGVFAMENTGDVISIWKWSQSNKPSDVSSANPNPANWGPPRAQWLSSANGACDLRSAVQQQSLVFDTTFCGDWAGNAFNGGIGACEAFVKNNPSAFSEAYWQINSLKVYTTDGQSAAPAVVKSTQIQTTSTDSPPPPPPMTTSSEVPAIVSSAVDLNTAQTTPTELPGVITSTTSESIALPETINSSSLGTATSINRTTSTTVSIVTETAASPTTTSVSAPLPPPPPAAATSNTASGLPKAPQHGYGHPHSHRHRKPAPTPAPISSSTPSPAKTIDADTPESVVVGPDGLAYEVQEPKAQSKRNVPPRRPRHHANHFRA